MKRAFPLLICFICFLALSCRREAPYITIEEDSISIPCAGGNFSVAVQTNTSVVPVSNQPWIQIISVSDGSLTFNVMENESDTSREGEVFLVSKGIQKALVVIQEQKPELSLSKESLFVPNSGETVSVTVKSNISYEVSVSDSWITYLPETKGASNRLHTFAVAPNTDLEERSAEIVFSNAETGLSEVFVVRQQALIKIVVAEEQVEVPFGESTLTVEVNTNSDSWEVISGVPWIYELGTKGMQSFARSFHIEPNNDTVTRIGYVLFIDKEAGQKARMIVSQNATPFLSVQDQLGPISCDGGSLQLDVQTNTRYGVRIDVDWVVMDEIQSSYGTVVLRCDNNPGHSTRYAQIRIFTEDGELYKDVLLVQNGLPFVLSYKQSGFSVSVPVIEVPFNDATVDWGDGVIDAYSPSLTHDYQDNKSMHVIRIYPEESRMIKWESIEDIDEFDFSSIKYY